MFRPMISPKVITECGVIEHLLFHTVVHLIHLIQSHVLKRLSSVELPWYFLVNQVHCWNSLSCLFLS